MDRSCLLLLALKYHDKSDLINGINIAASFNTYFKIKKLMQ